MANNSLDNFAIITMLDILINSHSLHDAGKLVVNIKNNGSTVNQDQINSLRDVWGSKLTVIHD